jgi:hypothetical protein
MNTFHSTEEGKDCPTNIHEEGRSFDGLYIVDDGDHDLGTSAR